MAWQRPLPSVAVSAAGKKWTVAAMDDETTNEWARDAVRELLQRCMRGLAQYFALLASGLDAEL
jgi:hypothetical protein